MRKFISTIFAFLWLVCIAQPGAASALYDWAFNVDGTTSENYYNDPLPTGMNDGGFDWGTGLGTLTLTVTGTGAHFFTSFFDHQWSSDAVDDTYFNEYGWKSGSPAAGQSWEIDEPGYVFGDIYSNVLDNTLDNTNSVDINFLDDVSMAMGWNFSLDAGQNALITLILSATQPTGGFYLAHTDPGYQETIYFSSTLIKRGGGDPTVPEPSTILLFGMGALGLAGLSRRRDKKA